MDKKQIIKRFVIEISRPLELQVNLNLIENVLEELKQFKLDDNDYGYLWKGIFYSIWYTEMGKGCEQIVEQLYKSTNSKLILNGFKQLNENWFSIDYIRIDKYMFLTRRLTHRLITLHFYKFAKSFKLLKKPKPSDDLLLNNEMIKKSNLLKSLLAKLNGVGLIDHLLDILYAECFKIIAPFLAEQNHKRLIAQFLMQINRTLICKLSKSSTKDQRVLAVFKIELFALFNHLKRNKYILKKVMTNLIEICKSASSSKQLRTIGDKLERKFNSLIVAREKQPDILPAKVKLTYNRKKALKNKRKRLTEKRRAIRKEKEVKLNEERIEIKKMISAEDQFNDLVGI